ncbi:putative pilus assembly protein FilE [Acinetobacter sp. A3.8]|uniref:Pilus assembly protein FilE n=1 Tax=Acinetobacter sedimenti TaxID=2919922 RepID=A0A9X1WX49_9GAMM|nr:putative pilus assembly protein FilE [Acinetobacter sedimenti]MCJ8146238.1 putative pilus assembly protein FilE [Acinetobacter sedimenti]
MQQFFFEKYLQQRNKIFLAVFCFGAITNYSYADTNELITIIGPDGLPMVVPVPEAKPKANKSGRNINNDTSGNLHEASAKQKINDQINDKSWFKLFSKTKDTSKNIDVHPNLVNEVGGAESVAQEMYLPVQSQKTKHDIQSHISSPSETSKSTDLSNEPQSDNKQPMVEQAPYKVIDGEKYYQAEYLESKEFNIEDKKRFYQIPTGVDGISSGAASWEVVERQKGVDMTVFRGVDTSSKNDVVTLGKNYRVIPKSELTQVIPLQCVDDKAIRKSKGFGRNDSVSFFPRAPFNDEFDFELLDFDQKVQNLKITSYASSDKSPTYYWPIVIFLDQKGCIIEGASAFHTYSNPATMLQSASIEGVIYIPKNSHYLLMSALEFGADVSELKLSNEGQIKLTLLR